MQELRANTQVIVHIGPFPDVGDGFTPQVDIDITGTNEAELLKHGASTVVDISGATWAAIANCRGWYNLTLTTSHTNTEGMLEVVIQDDSDCLPVHARFMVLSQAAWDSKYVAKDDGFMDVNLKTLGRTDTQETEVNNLESACGNYSATRGLTGTALPAVAAEAAGGLYTRGSGAGQIAQPANGQIDAALKAILATTLTETGGQLAGRFKDFFDQASAVFNVATALADFKATGFSTHDAAAVKTAIEAGGSSLAQILQDSGTTLPATLATIIAYVDELETRLTADRAGYLDALNGHTAQTGDSFARIGAAGASLTDLGGMSTAMKAEILSEVNAALDTAISELGVAQPTATPTIRTGLMLLYMALRNKLIVQTSGTDALEIHNNAGTKIASKAITDDGDDYTEAGMA